MRFLLVLALLTLSGCVTYKVQSSPDLDFDDAVGEIASLDDLNRRLSVENRQIIATTAIAEQTEAVFCSEPLLTLLTLGLVPRICIDSYRAILSSSENGGKTTLERDYKTKSVSGWLALLLLPFPDWKYGHEEDWSETIKLQILASPNGGHANYFTGCFWPEPAVQVIQVRLTATDPKRTLIVGQEFSGNQSYFTDPERANLMLLIGVSTCARDHEIPVIAIQSAVDEFRQGNYQNQWSFKKKLLRPHGIRANLICTMNSRKFVLCEGDSIVVQSRFGKPTFSLALSTLGN